MAQAIISPAAQKNRFGVFFAKNPGGNETEFILLFFFSFISEN